MSKKEPKTITLADQAKALASTEPTTEPTTEATVKTDTAERNAAWKTLLDYASKSEKAEIVEACKILRPSYFGLSSPGAKGDGLHPSFRKLTQIRPNVKVGDTITAMELFTTFRFGRTEAKNWCNELVKHPCGHPLTWIAYNKETDEYTVAHIGNDVPANWKGYVPFHLAPNGKSLQASR